MSERVRRAMVMCTRVGLIGEKASEPLIVERHQDGWVEIVLDDGVLLQLDPWNAESLRHALTDRGPGRRLPIVGEAA